MLSNYELLILRSGRSERTRDMTDRRPPQDFDKKDVDETRRVAFIQWYRSLGYGSEAEVRGTLRNALCYQLALVDEHNFDETINNPVSLSAVIDQLTALIDD